MSDHIGLNFSFVLLALILYTIFGSIIEHKKIRFVHESGLAIMFGLLYNIIQTLIDPGFETSFDGIVFFYALLPPIIFSAGYSMKKGDFFKNFSTIMLLGII